MKKLILLAVLISVPVLAQDTTHPRNMGLSADGYTRPDPGEFQLVLENGLIAYVAESGYVPLVTLSAFIRAGRVSDEKQGAAEVLEDAFKNILYGVRLIVEGKNRRLSDFSEIINEEDDENIDQNDKSTDSFRINVFREN